MFAVAARRIRSSIAQVSSPVRGRSHCCQPRVKSFRFLAVEPLEQRAMLAVIPPVSEITPSRGIVPTQQYFDEIGLDWTGGLTTFDDSIWTASTEGGPNGIGVPIGTGKFGSLASIDASSMIGVSNTALLRIPFLIDDLESLSSLMLNMRFDDGFIAYLNGQEVARQNAATGYPQFAEKATAHVPFEPSLAGGFTSYDISHQLSALVDGPNILAIRGLDRHPILPFPGSGGDFVIQATLTITREDSKPKANDDEATYRNDTPNPIIDVLTNDMPGDYPIAPATVEIVNPPDHGTATVNPNGTIVYSEDFEFAGTDTFTYRVRDTNPLQTPGGVVTPVTVVATTSPHRHLVPTAEIVPEAWKSSNSFNSVPWTSGTGGIGYDDNPDYDPYIGTGGDVTTTMDGVNSSIYVRYHFAVLDPEAVIGLRLRMRYDDGFIAYINGIEVQRQNFPTGAAPSWNSTASAAGEYNDPDPPEEFVIPITGISLRPGGNTNILAFHGLNDTANSSDFLLQPELIIDTVGTGLFSNEATVTVNVTGLGPKAIDDEAATIGREPVTIPVLENDTPGFPPPGDYALRPESLRVTTPPTNGVATINPATGEIIYRAHAGYFGEDTIEYTVRDSAPVGGQTSTVTLLPRRSTWRYLDNGSDQGTAWAAADFNDGAWKSGPARLGYGTTVSTTIDFGPNSASKHITTYFRSKFEIADPTLIQSLNVLADFDDGIVVYLNGVEMSRRALPTGELTYRTLAEVHNGGSFETLAVLSPNSLASLRPGTNVIAVEIHQTSPDSSDLLMDVELTATVVSPVGYLSNVATVNIAVASTNEPPVANDDEAMVKVERPAQIDVLANDAPDGAPIDAASVTIVSSPINGAAQVLADGIVSYSPAPGFEGQDSFTYSVRDTAGRVSNVATVYIDVVQSIPLPADDLYFVDEDDVLQVTPDVGVLLNDSDDGGTIVSAEVAVPPTHGILTFAADGSFQYAPDKDFFGDDHFRYRAIDSNNESAEATVTLRITPSNDAPLVVDDHYEATTDTPLVVLAAPRVRQTLVPAGANWRYLDTGSTTGSSWRMTDYDDSAWQVGAAQFGYGDGDEITVVSYGQFNERHITTFFRHEFSLNSIANLYLLRLGLLRDDGAVVYLNGQRLYANNLPSTVSPQTLALQSTTGDEENEFVEADFGAGLLAVGRNVIAVEVHQSSRTSNDMSFDLFMDVFVEGERNGGVLINDVDPEGDSLTSSIVSYPSNGSLSPRSDGGFTYTPDPSFVGTDTFTYRASDGEVQSEIATVFINVTAPPTSADLNADGAVDRADLAMVVAGLGTTSGADRHAGDVNGDGMVNLNDAMAVRQAFGQKAASAPGAIVAANRDPNPAAETPSQPRRGDSSIRAGRRAALATTSTNAGPSLDADRVDRAIGRVTASLTSGLRALRRR
jgi:VCBS repeat-containing protein